MKNLSIPAVAIAVFESLSIPGCVKEKIDDVRGDTGNAVTTTVEISEGNLLLMAAQKFELEGDFQHAAEAYKKNGYKVKAKKMLLMVAQGLEQKGIFWRAAMAYHKAGDKVKAQEMRLRDDARMSNGNVYEVEVGDDSCSCRD